MSPGRTKTEKLDDPRMWRKLVSLTHPDRDGDGDLFIWVRELQQAVTSGGLANARDGIGERQRREAQARAAGREQGRAEGRAEAEAQARTREYERGRTQHQQRSKTAQDSNDRVPFPAGADFEELTAKALSLADRVDQPFDRLLRLLDDCEPSELHEAEQSRGASYKSLAALGHQAQMPKSQRVRWYRIAEAVPLSQRHVGHIISRLGEDG